MTPSRIILGALFAAILLGGCSAHRTVPDEAPLAFRQAEDAFRLGDYDRAISGYRIFLRSDERDDLRARAYYKWALAEYRRGNDAKAIAVLGEMQQAFPDEQWPQVYALHGDAEDHRGNTLSALHWWEMAWQAGDSEEKQRISGRIQDALGRLDQKSLVQARSVLTEPDLEALVDRRVAKDESAGGGPVNGTRPVPKPVAAPPSSRPQPSLPEGVTPKVACLLPLSGPDATFGQRSLDGIRLALGDNAARILVVRDTAGQSQNARDAVDRVIDDPSIVAVIGPLRSKEAAAIAPRAERAGLPMVLLSQNDGLAGRFVLQPAMTPDRQAAVLAEYAVTGLRLARIGIIHPNDAYGTGLADAFRREVEARGGRIVGAQAYPQGTRDFGVEVLSVEKWKDEDGLQAIFLPDYADTATVLATELRRAQPTLALLGANGWNDPARLGSVAQPLDGAVFVDGFFTASARPATRAFVVAYQAAHQNTPGMLEAQAYDAANLLLQALNAGARSRASIIPQIQALGTLDGAAGTIHTSADGLQRDLFILRLDGGAIREVPTTHGRGTSVASEPPPPRTEALDPRE